MELFGAVDCGSSHATQPRIAAQEPMQCEGPEHSSVRPSFEALLRLERGLQAIGPVSIGDDAARELVDDFNAPVADDVVDVATQQRVGMQRAVHLGQESKVLHPVKAAAPKDTFDMLDACVGQLDIPPVFIGVEVHARQERPDELRQTRRTRFVAIDAARNDKRNARLVHHE